MFLNARRSGGVITTAVSCYGCTIRAIAAAVLLQALKDAQGGRHAQEAREWLTEVDSKVVSGLGISPLQWRRVQGLVQEEKKAA